jgi:hypothetical protein
MKTGDSVVIVVLVAVAVAVGWWFWGENVELITGGTFGAAATTKIRSDSVSLALGDLLLLKTPSGERAAIRFDRMTDDWGVDCTSWFVPAGSTDLSTPSQGHVFEKYWRTRTGKSSHRLKGVGGQYQVQCGPLSIGWSASTWLYIPDGYVFAVQTGGSEATPGFDIESLTWHTSHHQEDTQPTDALDSEIAAPCASPRSE